MMEVEIKTRTFSDNRKWAWPVLAVVWLAGACAPANMAKMTTLAPLMMEAFGISESGIGWVIALFYVLGIVVAFPAAAICNRFGLRKTIIAALVCGIVGGLLGVLSPSLTLFMVSRIFEGCGMGVMGVAGVAAISPWFPNSRKGLPLSLWALWVSVPTIVNPILYSWFAEATGTWKSSWWFMIAVSCIALVLFCLVYKEPNYVFDENERCVPASDPLADVRVDVRQSGIFSAFKYPAFRVLMVVVFVDGIGFMAMNGFITTYLTTVAGASLQNAAYLVSLGAVVGAVMSPVGGWLSDKIRSRKIVMLISLVFALAFMWLVFDVTDLKVYVVVEVICGIYCGVLGGISWATAGEIVPDEIISSGTAGLAFFQNLGFFVGAAGFGMLLEAVGSWAGAMHMVIVPLYAIATGVFLLNWRKLP